MPEYNVQAVADALGALSRALLGSGTTATVNAPAPDRTPVRRGTTELQLTLDVAHDGQPIDAWHQLEDFAREAGESAYDPKTVVQWLLSLEDDVTPTAWRATGYPSYSGSARR